jgi:hypothetical protein
MELGDGREPISDEEILYRRVSENSRWYDPNQTPQVSWVAFRPSQRDTTGLSVWRGKYMSAETAAIQHARPGRRSFVIELRAGDLRKIGVTVAPSADEGGPGHASLTNLSHSTYQSGKNEIETLARLIAQTLIRAVTGPYLASD